MSSLFGLLGTARDGMAAQSAALDVTGQNVANVSTPGYVRRGAVLEARATSGHGEGGVDVNGIARSFNRFTLARLVDERGRKGAADTRASGLADVESIVAPTTGGLTSSVNSLFSALSAFTANPTDAGTRSAVIASAGQVADNFHQTAADLASSRMDLATKAQGIAAETNDRLTEVAKLNRGISQAQARGEDASDLRDRRDVVLRELGDRIGARAVEDPSGAVTVFAASTTLVSGNDASSLSVKVGASGALEVDAQRGGGNVVDVTAGVTSGQLSGVLEVRDTDIPATQSKIDDFATALSGSLDAIHQAGYALDGSTGRPLFTGPSGAGAAYGFSVNAELDGHPELLAASSTASGLPAGNDVAVALANVGSQAMLGSSSPGAALGATLADVGTRKAAADSELSLRQDTVTQADSINESQAGVSLDEEMVNLTKYQRAFEASTRVLQATDQLLDGLIRDL